MDGVLLGDAAGATGNPTITLDSALSPAGVTVSSTLHNYMIAGSGGIGGAGKLTLDAANTKTLTLTTANTYTGGTFINGGTLKLSGVGTLGAAGSPVAVSSGGLLDLNGTNQSIVFAAGTGLGIVANNSGSGTSTLTIAGTPTINGALVTIQDNTDSSAGKVAVVITANTQPMSNANTYSGGTTVNAAAFLYLNSSSPLGAGTGPINLTTAGTGPNTGSGLVVDGVTYPNDITGAGYVHNNANSGATVVTTTFTGNINTSGPFIFRAGTGIVFNFAGNETTSTLSGVIGSTTSMVNGAVATGSIIKSGTGILTLSGTNTYTGTTTVSGGTLNLAGSSSGTLGAITVAGAGTTAPILNIQAGTYTQGAGGFFLGTATGPGIVNQTGGAVTWNSSSLELLIGNGGVGTYNLSGGSVTTIASTARGVMLGVNPNSTATFNLSGTGTLTTTGSLLMIGRSDASASNTTNLFSQTGGTATIATLTMGGPVSMTTSESVTATLNLSGGTFTAAAFSLLSAAAGDTSAINISGTADVTLPAFPTARGTGSTATLTFDGGKLRSAAASATFMGGLTSASIKAGGATFEPASGKDITITQALLTDTVSTGGGLTKSGAGVLALSGTNTYTGATSVNAGTLLVNSPGSLAAGSAVAVNGTSTLGGSGTLGGSVTVAADARLAPGASAAGTLTVSGALDISALAGGAGTLAYELGTLAGTNDKIVAGTLAIGSGALGFNDFAFTNLGGLEAGTYKLITSGGITGTLDAANLSGMIGSFKATLQLTGNDVELVVSSPYASWAALMGLDDSDAAHSSAKNADPDGDGKNNLYEFAFDGNPLSGANDGKIVGKVATVGGAQVMTLTLPVRTGATFSVSSGDQLSALIDGIYYRVEGDETLSTFADAITEVPAGADLTAIQAGLPALSSGWTYRTFRAPGTVPVVPKAFLRAKISETP